MRSAVLILSALVSSAALPAQATFTIPNGFATAEAPSSSNLPWGYGAVQGSRTMYAYDASHFTNQGILGPTLITRMRWRGNGGVVYPGGGVYGLAIVKISTMPNPISTLALGLPFAGQHGGDMVTAYSGAVSVGALSGSTPNDWHIDVTLQSPFLYDPTSGNPILIELACDETQYTGPAMGNIRIDLAANASSGYNRMYDVNSHVALNSTGANECGAVVELTGTWPLAAPITGRFTIPNGFASTEAGSSSNLPWGYGAVQGSRTMYAYDATHFTLQGITGPTTITRMRWRGNGGVIFPGGGVYGLAIIKISTMPNPISVLATGQPFAGQHGGDMVTAYSGAVSVGALTGTTPNDWHIDVTLQQPFTYDPSSGSPILIELACDETQYTGPAMGNVRLDLDALAGNGYNRMYDTASHVAPTATGDNECGAVVELFTGMHSDVGGLDTATGGTQQLMVNGSLANAGMNYWIFGSITGSTPGLNLLGVHIPLNVDVYTDITISSPPTGVFQDFRGVLDANGMATAKFNVPPAIPVPLFFNFYHSAVIYNGGSFLLASGAVTCRMN